MWARTGCATEHERGALTGGRAWTGCPDRRQSVSAAHALTDWQGNTDTARCTALVQRVGAARALTTGRQYARARFPIDRRGVLLYPVSIGLKRVPHSNPTAKQFRKEVRRDERYNVLYVRTDQKILSIDSPTGFTAHAAEYVLGAYKKLGYDAKLTNKGGIFVCVNDGPDQADDPADAPILLEAHMDTLGGMVCSINEKGRLMLSALGGMNPNNAEAENCRVYTRSGKVYSGTFQLKNASIHVNGSYNDTARSYDAMEVVLDEPVESKADTEALGIMTGDIVCFDPRTTVTESGYIKSRFLDDKLSVGILLGFAKYLKETAKKPARKIYQHITVLKKSVTAAPLRFLLMSQKFSQSIWAASEMAFPAKKPRFPSAQRIPAVLIITMLFLL